MGMRARHISIRVPWHDSAWDGTVCQDPEANCHCVEYENIAKGKEVEVEIRYRGARFADFERLSDLPPCIKESGGFLSPVAWKTSYQHPYRNWPKLKETHGHLKETILTVPAYTAHAVPFRWLNRNNLDGFTQSQITEPLPADTPPDFYRRPWVFQPHIQRMILDGFFAPVVPNESLAFFYTKSRQPIFEDVDRLIVGIGDVVSVGRQHFYKSTKRDTRENPIWDRDITHSLRPGGTGGLLIPYHEYLAPTGDPARDKENQKLVRQLRITPEAGHAVQFSYRSEHVADDVAVSVLTQAIRVVHLIREHGVVKGDWAACEHWLDDRLARAWRLRGEHPGIGPVLQAAGLPMASSLVHSLDSTDTSFREDPWRAVSHVLDGTVDPPHPRYRREIEAFAKEWFHLSNQPGRMALARALSRIALDNDQAIRWWDRSKRPNAMGVEIDDDQIIDNPYLISEWDTGTAISSPVSITTIDRAVFRDATASDSDVSTGDVRRVRAAVVAVLREAEEVGDTLLGVEEVRDRAEGLPLSAPITIGPDWMTANVEELAGVVTLHESDGWVQLSRRSLLADRLSKILSARARKVLPLVDEDWLPLLEESIRAKSDLDELRARHPDRVEEALNEQVVALQRIVSRRLTTLVGRAGTGKTTVLGALSRSSKIGGPVLFLAPTGKARVRLTRNVAPGSTVRTVAQYLLSQGAYDPKSQKPVVLDDGTYDGHRTVVIDESSMLTEDTLLAVLSTFTPNVQRLILVGDTAQLPPIGPGRPFADLVAHLSGDIVFADDDPVEVAHRNGAYARLTVEVRSHQGEDSDTLQFAKFFTGDPLPINSEEVIEDLMAGRVLNDLDVRYWDTDSELRSNLAVVLHETLGLERGDTAAFNELLGITFGGKYWNVTDPDSAESWQILSPVRGDLWGVAELNRWVQREWRGPQLESCRSNFGRANPFGPNEIIRLDKVLLTANLASRRGYDHAVNEYVEEYLANGDIGLCSNDSRAKGTAGKGSVMDVMFAGHSGQYGFKRSEFGSDTGNGLFELAYALTIHKAQGSDFGTVIVVLPRQTRINSRELLYTALTRSRERLVLLVEGSDLSSVLELTHENRSETIKRNSNLFRTSVRGSDDRPWAHHLVHRASDGTPVRSKSELKIMDDCLAAGLRPRYEQRLDSLTGDGSFKLPDFTFVTDGGDSVIWEHLGMLDTTVYSSSWERKRQWYRDNGFIEDQTLFTTSEVGGLQSSAISQTIEKVRKAIKEN